MSRCLAVKNIFWEKSYISMYVQIKFFCNKEKKRFSEKFNTRWLKTGKYLLSIINISLFFFMVIYFSVILTISTLWASRNFFIYHSNIVIYYSMNINTKHSVISLNLTGSQSNQCINKRTEQHCPLLGIKTLKKINICIFIH